MTRTGDEIELIAIHFAVLISDLDLSFNDLPRGEEFTVNQVKHASKNLLLNQLFEY